MRIRATKTYRTAEWAKASKAPKAVADLMAENGFDNIHAGGVFSLPDKLAAAILKDKGGEEA